MDTMVSSSVSQSNLDQQSACNSDVISQLPEHILLQVLSLLTVTEAGRTCLLSHRWQNLWKFTTRLCLDRLMSRSIYRHVKLVKRILSLHESPKVDEVRIDFDLGVFFRGIDEVIMNLPKRLKRLEINLEGAKINFKSPLLEECYRFFKSVSNLSNTECLISLTLVKSHVDGKLLEDFLSKCPNLTMLSVSRSDRLVHLKVEGPSLRLKHLEISCCPSMESIELCAPKLVTLNYNGKKRIVFIVGRNPNLTELILGRGYEEQIWYALSPFSSHLSRIKTFKITMDLKKHVKKEIPREIPELIRNLEHLILSFTVGKYSDGLVDITSRVLAAAPNLKKITFHLSLFSLATTKQHCRPIEPQPRQGLKEVEIFGFGGVDPEFELAKYLLKIAVNLEKMVVDPFYQLDNGGNRWIVEQPKADKRGKLASELKRFLRKVCRPDEENGSSRAVVSEISISSS